jgi:hypothetical protein
MTARTISPDAWSALNAAGQAIQAATNLLDVAIAGDVTATAATASAAIEPLLDAARISIEMAGAVPGEDQRRRLHIAICDYIDVASEAVPS